MGSAPAVKRIAILLPDGTDANATERTESMSTTPNTIDHATNQGGPTVRTIAVVAAELESAIAAAGRVKALTEELHGMIGKKRRARKDNGSP